MQNNFYVLRQLSRELNEKLKGYTLYEVFTQIKNEVIFAFYLDRKEFYLRVNLGSNLCCVSSILTFSKAKKNALNFFQSLHGLQLIDVVQVENDRSFLLRFPENHTVLIKLHGSRANIIYYQNDKVAEVYKSSLQYDQNLKIEELSKKLSLTKSRFEEVNGNLKVFIPTAAKIISVQLRITDPNLQPASISWEHISPLLQQLENPTFFYVSKQNEKPALSIFEPETEHEKFSDCLEALNSFYFKYVREYTLYKRKNEEIRILEKDIKKTRSYIAKNEQKLAEIAQRQPYSEVADIIMANLHAIPHGAEEVELLDFYNNKNLKVKLKSKLTPQKNAELLYKKAKNQVIEQNMLYENTLAAKEKLARLENQAQEILEVQDAKALKGLQKTRKSVTPEQNLPYHLFEEDGFQIMVGKNATRNDELSFKIANKDDLWLHAKDTPGSHVIVRKKPGQNFSKSAIERAAGLAAYYSKRKTEALCPVIYTPKKYIRKVKGLSKGQVIVQQEKVVIVPPQK